MGWMSEASCCDYLASSVGGLQVSFPNTIAYNSSQSAYWSLYESALTPSCIITPQSSQDVANAISALTLPLGCCANEHFAIKSGGHAPASGFANIASPGLTIDLTLLHAITVNDDHLVASVGPGASWDEVYAALDPIGKSVAGARNGRVGVGGLTLSGGISYFGPQVGFTCDTVINFEVALASGRLVNANTTHNTDLFKALKGGGNNFGLVTRFDFSTVDISQIMAGSITHQVDAQARSAVFKAFADVADADVYDVHASLVTGLFLNATAGQWALLSTPIYTLPQLDTPVFDALFAAPNIASKKSIVKLSVLANESATPPLNWLFRTGTYGVSEQMLELIFEICNSTLLGFEVPGTLIWSIALEPLPTVFTSRGAGTNALGTSAGEGNSMILLVSAGWSGGNSSASLAVQAKADEVLTQVNAATQELGLARSFVYANYAGAKQHPYQSYGQQNEALLWETSRKYDPRGVFQRRVTGGFKLWL